MYLGSSTISASIASTYTNLNSPSLSVSAKTAYIALRAVHNNSGNTEKKITIAQTLLDKGFDINSPIDGEDGHITLLKLAIEQRDSRFADFLLQNNAHPDAHDRSSWVMTELSGAQNEDIEANSGNEHAVFVTPARTSNIRFNNSFQTVDVFVQGEAAESLRSTPLPPAPAQGYPVMKRDANVRFNDPFQTFDIFVQGEAAESLRSTPLPPAPAQAYPVMNRDADVRSGLPLYSHDFPVTSANDSDCVSSFCSGLAATGYIVGSAAVGGAVVGGVEAGVTALAGYAGASILQHYYKSYDPTEAVQMGLVGGAVIGGAIGALVGPCVIPVIASGKEVKGGSNSIAGVIAGTVLTGLAGYGIMNDGSSETAMNLGQTAALFAVGAGVVTVGSAAAIVAAVCVAAPIACFCACISPKREQPAHSYTV